MDMLAAVRTMHIKFSDEIAAKTQKRIAIAQCLLFNVMLYPWLRDTIHTIANTLMCEQYKKVERMRASE